MLKHATHIALSAASMMGFLLTTDCHATEPAALTPLSATNARHELTAEDLSSFTERIIGDELRRFGIPGAVVVAVKDGNVLLSRGYGFADLAKHRPMTADATLVNVASITKLFWGIGVMQLVEQGKLDLDRDVNDYLDFHIPTPPGGVPVTLRRLLTHRAGFADKPRTSATLVHHRHVTRLPIAFLSGPTPKGTCRLIPTMAPNCRRQSSNESPAKPLIATARSTFWRRSACCIRPSMTRFPHHWRP